MSAPTIGRRVHAPTYASVDVSSPLAAGLLFALVGNRDAVSGQGITSAVVGDSTNWGRGYRAGSAITFPAARVPTGPWSALVVAKFTDGGGATCAPIAFGNGSSNGVIVNVRTTGVSQYQITYPGVNNYTPTGANGLRSDQAIFVVTATAAAGTITGYRNGVALGTVATSSYGAPTAQFLVYGGMQADTGVALACVWNRCLSAAEVMALTADPFTMLRW